MAVGLSVYNNNQSARDRARLQTIDAAEAGINQATRTLEASTLTALPCAITGQLTPTHRCATRSPSPTTPPTAERHADALPADGGPSGGDLRVAGHLHREQPGPPKMVSQVRLTPRYGGFDTATFADTGLTTANHLNIHGNEGNDADVYTNGDSTCDNSMALEGNLCAQGQVGMSNTCSVAGDVYARQAITMADNSTIGHDAISARSSIQLTNSARIVNNATAATTITAPSGAIGGSRVQTTPRPTRPPGPCRRSTWESNSTVRVDQDLATIFDWQVGFQNKSDWVSGDGQEHSVLFINPSSTRTTCGSRNPAFSTTNNTSFATSSDCSRTRLWGELQQLQPQPPGPAHGRPGRDRQRLRPDLRAHPGARLRHRVRVRPGHRLPARGRPLSRRAGRWPAVQ